MAATVSLSSMFGTTVRMRKAWKQGMPAVSDQARARLARLVRHAAENVPFYRERYKGIDLQEASLGDLPPFDKYEFMEDLQSTFAPNDLDAKEILEFVQHKELVGSLYRDKYIIAHTSGSSGFRGHFVQDLWGWTISEALMMKKIGRMPSMQNFFRWFSIRNMPPWEVAVVIPTGGHYTSMLIPMIAPAWRDRMAHLHYINILDPIESIIDRLNETPPIYLHAYPTMLHALAQAQIDGALDIAPLIVSCSSEPFSGAARLNVNLAWPDALVLDMYAATEVTPIARDCAFGRLHLLSDWIIVEPVDEQGEPVAPGEMSRKIYITHLFNRVQPLIRYEMTDTVRFLEDECECGCPIPIIEVGGRTNDTLYVTAQDGHRITLLPTPILVAFMEVPNLKQYQIIYRESTLIEVRYTVDRRSAVKQVNRDIRRVFGEYLEHHGVNDLIEIEPKHVEDIERDQETHKILQVINEVN